MTLKNRKILNFVRKVHENWGIIGVISNAGLVAISSGIVKGMKVPGSRKIKDDLENAGLIWIDQPAC